MFRPKRIIFEKDSLEYELGKKIYEEFKDNENVEIVNISSNRVKQHIPGENLPEQYQGREKNSCGRSKEKFKVSIL